MKYKTLKRHSLQILDNGSQKMTMFDKLLFWDTLQMQYSIVNRNNKNSGYTIYITPKK